jgi:hypothetical protein
MFLALPLSTWFSVVLPFSVVICWSLWALYALTLHPLASVPGQFWASVSRLWYVYRIYTGDIHDVQRRLHEQYGTIVRIAPNEVSTTELSAIPKIYRNQAPFTKADFYSI